VSDGSSGPVVPAAAIEVSVGDAPVSSGRSWQTAAVIVRHPLWDASAIDDDWALVELPAAETATRPALAAAAETVASGTSATIAGWGQTAESSSLPDALQTATLPVHDDATCLSAYAGFDPATQICAGTGGGVGPVGCHGDSGGPLLVPDLTATWRVVGVVSYGQSAGCLAQPTVFARVSAARSFIDSVVAAVYGPPTISAPSVHATGETTAGATLTLRSGGMPTTYRVEYGYEAGHYGARSRDAQVAAGSVPTTVTVQLGQLHPFTVYHAVVRAWSAVGSIQTADISFKTPDRTAPRVRIDGPLRVRRGRRLQVGYTVTDASARADVEVGVSRAGRAVRGWQVAPFKLGTPPPAIVWQAPRRRPFGGYRLCLVAVDGAGNRSAAACAPIVVRRR